MAIDKMIFLFLQLVVFLSFKSILFSEADIWVKYFYIHFYWVIHSFFVLENFYIAFVLTLFLLIYVRKLDKVNFSFLSVSKNKKWRHIDTEI